MERLKPLEEVCQPDVRYRNRVDLDKATGAVSETTIQSIYALIEPMALNESVPDDVRSHFEMALRLKAGDKKSSFKSLMDNAFKNRQLTGGLGPPIDLSVAVSRMRNDLAHGSRTMHGQGIAVLRLCAELINELFE